MEAVRPLGDRERFVAFAFAAADMLVEIGLDGRIGFAAGAFRHRLGREPESMVGHSSGDILAVEDRDAFAAALALLPERGRLAPTAFRLNDAERTAFAVAGIFMAQPGCGGRICLTFAPLPACGPLRPTPPGTLVRLAEQRLREGDSANLSLIEVHGVPDADAEKLQTMLTRESGGALAARLAPGRYGLMQEAGAPAPDMPALARGLQAALGDADGVSVNLAAQIDLDAGTLSPVQAARALRHGLSVFARLGAEGLKDAGFPNGLESVVSRVTSRAGGLRRAVSDRKFRLDFQPIVKLSSREVHHFEALLRPNPDVLQPGEGPQDFATLAEAVGLTEELDLAVAAVTMAATSAAPAGRHLAFNISGLSAQSETFRTRLLAMLDRDSRAAARIMVELTESAEIEHEAQAAETLAQLRARGVPVCLDDFGAGAAAFRYLRAFAVDYVKVDGSYVVAALNSERDRSFVQAMVDLSQAVGARVVAEHIETEACASLMQELGVEYGQGWLFGKAGPL